MPADAKILASERISTAQYAEYAKNPDMFLASLRVSRISVLSVFSWHEF
jgi:hypothetical protein